MNLSGLTVAAEPKARCTGSVWRFPNFLELTLLATTATGFGTVLPTPLPDAASAVLADAI